MHTYLMTISAWKCWLNRISTEAKMSKPDILEVFHLLSELTPHTRGITLVERIEVTASTDI
jgi:hypothetical protein